MRKAEKKEVEKVERKKVGRCEGGKKKSIEQRFEFGSRTRRRPKRTGLCRGKDAEGGPVVVPKGQDYAVARMRKAERKKA